MYEVFEVLYSIFNASARAGIQFREAFQYWISDPIDAWPPQTHALAFAIIALWILGGIFLKKFLPSVSKKHLEDPVIIKMALSFIVENLNLPKDSIIALPSVRFVETEPELLLDPDIAYLYDEVWGTYHPKWKRIFLINKNIHFFIHQLTHHVQHMARNTTVFEDRDEAEAWRITRKFLRTFYPKQYWTLMFLYGHRGLWDAPKPKYMVI